MSAITIIDNTILTAALQASSFPEGVEAAHKRIHDFFSEDGERLYFGISRPEGNRNHIVYKAAVSISSFDEALVHGLEVFMIPAGRYATLTIEDYMINREAISNAFDELLKHPMLDRNGFCLEVYDSERSMRCLVPLE